MASSACCATLMADVVRDEYTCKYKVYLARTRLVPIVCRSSTAICRSGLNQYHLNQRQSDRPADPVCHQ